MRRTLERAVLVTTLLTPLLATVIGFGIGPDKNFPSDAPGWLVWFVSVPMGIYPLGLFGTIVGILLVALPVTYALEKLGNGHVLAILIGNLLVGAIGFVMAARTASPSEIVAQIFWLHWGLASVIFTALYLFRSERPTPANRLADA